MRVIDRPLRIAGFVERYLEPEQTFVFRQMAELPADHRFFARYRIRGHPYPEDHVQFLNDGAAPSRGWLAWQVHRLRQRLTGRYATLTGSERRLLSAQLRGYSPDVVHAHWAPDAMLVDPVARRLGVPVLVHFHGYDVSRLTSDAVYLSSLRALFAGMAMAITVSEEMRARVIALGCPPDRVRCHHTGVPEAYFARGPRRRLPSARFTLLQVGRLTEVKGHPLSIAAVARLAAEMPGLVLRVVGDGHRRAALEERVVECGIADRVQFVGARSADAVVDEMARADALLMPSCRAPDGGVEGLPNVVVEGLAGALPVIATRHGGITEALTYDDPEWLVPEEDAVEELVVRIRRLASDTALWDRLSRRGQEIARERFHLPTQNRKLEGLYREMLADR